MSVASILVSRGSLFLLLLSAQNRTSATRSREIAAAGAGGRDTHRLRYLSRLRAITIRSWPLRSRGDTTRSVDQLRVVAAVARGHHAVG